TTVKPLTSCYASWTPRPTRLRRPSRLTRPAPAKDRTTPQRWHDNVASRTMFRRSRSPPSLNRPTLPRVARSISRPRARHTAALDPPCVDYSTHPNAALRMVAASTATGRRGSRLPVRGGHSTDLRAGVAFGEPREEPVHLLRGGDDLVILPAERVEGELFAVLHVPGRLPVGQPPD